MINIKVEGLEALQKRLTEVAKTQLPAGMMFGLAKVGQGILQEQKRVMKGVFDSPTPFTLNAPKITHWPKKSELWLDIGLKETPTKDSTIMGNTLEPHIPGFRSNRNRKGAEKWLRASGLMDNDEWLMPARTFKFDRYGNVPGPTMQKMLADLDVYSKAQWRAPIKKTGVKKGRYMWGTVTGRKGQPVRGIFSVQGGNRNWARGRWSLEMVVVKKQPRYEKRFAYHAVAQRYANRHLVPAIESGLVKALMTMR